MHFLAVMLLLLSAEPNGSTPTATDALHKEIARRIAELDSDRYAVRSYAAEKLEQMVVDPKFGLVLAKEFQRVLIRTDVSLEVRKRLERWRRVLPKPPPEPVGDVRPEEIDTLIRQLEDDSYAVRIGAVERLNWWLGEAKLGYPLMERIKRRLADERFTTAESRRPLETAYHKARGVWLTDDVARQTPLPEVADAQIERWLDDLIRGDRSSDAAERELLDLLARDRYVPRLKKMLAERLERSKNREETERLQALLDWTKPAMVAEYWCNRSNGGQQHLLIGVPSLGQNATKPSHFDRIDDKTAHCVSGQNLAPGDYPVGVAFPHPSTEGAFFLLLNLPTPQRRMAYPYLAETDESQRLTAISRRTLDAILAQPRPLLEPEIVMLSCLDPIEVSRFAGKYFMLVEDGLTAASGRRRFGGRPSRFGMICTRLAADGTKEAAPGLLDAIAKNRFIPPTLRAPYKLHLIAALSIADRDPWPTADQWLAEQIDSDASLSEVAEDSTAAMQLGATAAAILLTRHDQSPSRFGVLPVVDQQLEQIEFQGYRYSNADAKKKVRQWWQAEKDKKKTP